MKAFEPDWVFDKWVDGAAVCYNAEAMQELGEWSWLHSKLMLTMGIVQMWLFGWWKHPQYRVK